VPTPLDDKSYPHSLSVRLKLTADDLAQHPGALDLWTAAAIFPTAFSDDLLTRLEEAGGWRTARSALVGHHVLTRRDDHWHMLPLVMGAANAFCDLARCHHALGNARQRDLALVSALEAASSANAVRVTQSVEQALLSITGSHEAAQEWRERHGVK
jgi:hypothetical protein